MLAIAMKRPAVGEAIKNLDILSLLRKKNMDDELSTIVLPASETTL